MQVAAGGLTLWVALLRCSACSISTAVETTRRGTTEVGSGTAVSDYFAHSRQSLLQVRALFIYRQPIGVIISLRL